jgi:hypothetical protein
VLVTGLVDWGGDVMEWDSTPLRLVGCNVKNSCLIALSFERSIGYVFFCCFFEIFITSGPVLVWTFQIRACLEDC